MTSSTLALAQCANCGGSYRSERAFCPRCRLVAKRRRSAADQLTPEERALHDRMVRRSRLAARVLFALGGALLVFGVGRLFVGPAAQGIPVAALVGLFAGGLGLMTGHLIAWRSDALEAQVL